MDWDMEAGEVYGVDGRLGMIDPATRLRSGGSHVLIRPDSGGPGFWAPAGSLERRPNGSYFLPIESSQLQVDLGGESGQGAVILALPVIQEELDVSTRRITRSVRLTKQVHEREELVDEPASLEEVEVKRVPRNQVVEQAPRPYQEGDTWVIPLVEEVLVVEKRLVLREEVRVTRRRREVRQPQRVTLRREEIVVEEGEGKEGDR